MKSVLTARSTSSKSDFWGTELALADALVSEFKLNIDAAAMCLNTKCGYYMGPDHQTESFRDALTVPWSEIFSPVVDHPRFFLNPPFSLMNEFIDKVLEEQDNGLLTVAVLPVKTETKWWHKAVPHAQEVRLLKGRLYYEELMGALVNAEGKILTEGGLPVVEPDSVLKYEESNPAIFPSCVVIWNGESPTMTGGPRFTHWDWRS